MYPGKQRLYQMNTAGYEERRDTREEAWDRYQYRFIGWRGAEVYY